MIDLMPYVATFCAGVSCGLFLALAIKRMTKRWAEEFGEIFRKHLTEALER